MNVDQLVSPQVRSLEPDTDEGANGMHEVTEGLFGVFVEQEDVDAQPPVPDGRMMPMTQREEEGGIPQQTMTVTIDAPPSSTGEAVRQTAAALALPMKHRHHLTPDVVQRASSLASSSGVPTAGSSREHNDGLSHHKSNASPLNDDDRSAAELRNTVPEPRGPNPSPGMQALGASLRGSIQNVGDGGGPKHRSPRLPEVPPISTLLQPMPFPGVQRSDIDDALIMQHLLERHRKMRLAAMRTQERNARTNPPAATVEGSDDDEDGDGDFVPDGVLSPRAGSAGTSTGSPNIASGPSELQRHLTAARRRKLTFVQDDVFLESLDLTALDDHVDWLQPTTFRTQWWSMMFARGKVERDFLRYEMHHHRFQPLLIFASSMLIVVLGISVAMWTYRPTESLSVIWNVLLGAIVAVVATIVVAIRLFDRDRDGNARSSSAGGSDSSANHKKKSRSNELWSARVAEFCAWALQIAAIWGTLSAYSYVAATCYHTQVFYVPWIKGCVNTTERASATLRPSHFFHEDHRCPAIEYYCERSMYSFVVPAIFTAVILFRPRAVLAVPTIASAPFAFAASRQVTSDAMDVDSESVFWSKLILICAFCIFGIAVKIALEREQRRRFRAYATLYHQLSQYVRHREALADFLDAKLPPILRSRLLNGNVSLDSSQLATCIMFDLAEYPTWCTRMMPLAAATSVAQLHDVISARSAAAGVEKIRAFGDVFVGASNLAVESPHHAALCCQLALQIFSDAFEFRAAFAAPLALRCGLHSGTLIGLVLGATYRRYDIFGDAIATASRVLDVTQGNQIVLTDTTAEEAQEFAIMAPRGDEQQQPGSQGGAATEITSPFTRRTHPLFVLTSLRKLVPTCEAYVALLQENVNHKERACRQKKQWATNMSRARDDALVEVAATLASDIPLHEIIVKSSQEDVRMLSASDSSRHESYVVPRIPTEGGRVDGVPPLPPPSLQHQQQQQRSPQQRATFEVVASMASSPQHLQAATKQRGPRSSLIPFDRPHQPLYDPTELRDYVVLHNSSTKMLEKAIQDSRLKQECGPLLKRFVLNLHELEFSLSYLRAADRVPYVVSLVALAMLYVTMIALSLYEAHYFPPQVEGLLNTTLIDLNRDLNDGGAVVGAILLAIAAAVSLGTACVVQLAPNFISENSMIMWLLACANCSFAYFGAAVSAPGVVGSDATYLFWFSITTLHFGSWNFSGLVLITVVSLGVFLAATNTITGTYLPIWTLPMLFIASTLNMYFDRNRERRLREMYRDLFLTKAASKAVEGEGHVRRSVLRATIPRPLMPLATDVASQGRLLTTSLTESIVMHIRLDTINEDVITSLMRQCDQKMVGLRRDGSALSQIATALLPGGIAASPVDPLGGSGRRFPPSEDSPSPRGANIAHALAAVEESSSIIETLLNSMTGTELAMVQIFGDDVTIAGPLEEEDTRGLPTGQPTRPPVGVGEELGGGNGGVEQGDGRATTSRKQNLEARVQRAAYDTMLLIAQLYRLQSRLRKHASMSSSVGTSASSPRGREDAELLETPLGESGNMQSSSHRTFGFSAVCVCDTIINVLANGEYPSYDLLGSASYFSRVLMQQLPQRGCIATERFVQYYQEEIRAAAAAEGIMIPNTMLGFAGRPEECSTAKFQTTTLPTNSGGSHDPPPPAVAASSSGSPPRVEGASGSLAVGSGSSPTTDGVGGGGGGEVDSDEWATTPAPQPRVGEVERWRVRGLGTLWVYPILPGLE